MIKEKWISSYEQVKQDLFLRAMSMGAVPKEVPCRIIAGDMVAVCGIEIERNGDEVRSVTVTESMLKALGVSRKQLFRDAEQNAPKNRPAVLRNMASVMQELAGDDELFTEDSPLMVAGVRGNIFGAAVIAYPGFLEETAKRMGSFYILPSSVHEVLLVADDGEPKATELNAMIRTINRAEVLPQDRLSDIAYHFDGKHLETAQDYEDRQ